MTEPKVRHYKRERTSERRKDRKISRQKDERNKLITISKRGIQYSTVTSNRMSRLINLIY